MATIDEFALKNIGFWWRYGISRHSDEWKYIIIGRIFESEIILIPPSSKISESSSNGSYRNTDEVWWRYGISRSCDECVQIDIVWYIFETRIETKIFASWTKATLLKIYFRNLSVQRSFLQYKSQCLEKVNVKYVIKRLWHDIFHIVPGINPRPISSLQLRRRAWYGSLGLIPGPIWKISCNNLLIWTGILDSVPERYLHYYFR